MKITSIIAESQHKCPHCGGPVVEYSELAEGKKDACYYKVKASAKVWPSAYASGRLVQCRKKGAGNYGKGKNESVAEVAPPGAKAERMVKHIKKSMSKDGKLSDKEKSIAYATAWKAHNKDVTEGTQRVDSLVTDALKIMQGSEGSDAVAALKTVLGDREYNSRRGFYNFYVRQLMDMSGQQGVAEGSLEANTPNPIVVIQDLKGNILDKVNLSVAVQKYKLGNSQDIKNQLAHQNYTTIGNYVVVAPMTGQPQDNTTQGVAEGSLEEACWDTHKQVGMKKKGGRMVPDCRPKESIEENDMDKYNPEYDDEAGMAENNLQTLARAVEGIDDLIQIGDNLPEWCQEKIANAKSMLVAVWDYMESEESSDEVDPEIDAMFEAMDQLAEEMAIKNRVSKDLVWEQFEAMPDNMLYETAAWRRKEGKSAKGGLNAKGVASYRRENPGSKLQTAVTTKPSKLKPGSKAAKRRKSFCARMGGVKGPMKKPNGKPTRKALALRKWNC